MYKQQPSRVSTIKNLLCGGGGVSNKRAAQGRQWLNKSAHATKPCRTVHTSTHIKYM